ncbi:hypothetical protein SO694_00048111 [Aureococcus anophagefferens]|uniref:Inositol 1,4,5-trisphosphate/ryanodine receptor domain-containing protein n=1 Tax=Aureococcus anophagefferens TaxID=44056 RepID=A0ABR1G801_AURAN
MALHHAGDSGTSIRLGDTICLALIGQRGFLTADGVSDNNLVFEKLHHGVNMPPNPRDVRFVVRRMANRRAQNELNRLHAKADYGYGGAVNGSGYDGRAELQRLAELEEQQNADDNRRLHRTPVGTGKVLCIVSDQGPNPGTLDIQLKDPSEASSDAHVRLFPALNSHDSHVDALTIRNGNLVVLEFVEQAMRLLITDGAAADKERPAGTLRTRGHPHVSRVDGVCATHTAGLRMEIMQLRAAEPETSLEKRLKLARRLNGSDVVKLAFTQTLEELALPAASWSTSSQLPTTTRPVFDRSIYKQQTFTNSMSWWVLEKTEMPSGAEEILAGVRHHYRIKHFVTGVYLGYVNRGQQRSAEDEGGIELTTWRSLREDKLGTTLFSLRLVAPGGPFGDGADRSPGGDAATAPLCDGDTVNIVSVVSGYALNCHVAVAVHGREPRLEAFKGAHAQQSAFAVHRCAEEEARKVVFARSCRNKLVLCVGFEDKNKRHTRAMSIKSSADALYALSSAEEQQQRVDMLTRTIDDMRATCGGAGRRAQGSKRVIQRRFNADKGKDQRSSVAYSMQMLLAEQDIPRLVLTALQMCRNHLDTGPGARGLSAACAKFLLKITAGNMVVKRLLAEQEALLFDFLGKEVDIEALLVEIYRDNQAALRDPKEGLIDRLFQAGSDAAGCLPEILELYSALTVCDGVPMKHNQDLIAATVFAKQDGAGFFPRVRAAPDEHVQATYRLFMKERAGVASQSPASRPASRGEGRPVSRSGRGDRASADAPAAAAPASTAAKRGVGGMLQRGNATIRHSMIGRSPLNMSTLGRSMSKGDGLSKGRRQASQLSASPLSRQKSKDAVGNWVDACSYMHITEHIVSSKSQEPEHRLLVYVRHTFVLLADLCGHRNRNARKLLLRQPALRELVDYAALTGVVQSAMVPSFVRSAASRLWHALYVDAEPHAPQPVLCTARSRSHFRVMVKRSDRFDEADVDALSTSVDEAPSLPKLFADVMHPLASLTGSAESLATDPTGPADRATEAGKGRAFATAGKPGEGRSFGTNRNFGGAQKPAAHRRSLIAEETLHVPGRPQAAGRRRSTLSRVMLAAGGSRSAKAEEATSNHRLELILCLLKTMERLLSFGVVDAVAAVVPDAAVEASRGADAPEQGDVAVRGTLAAQSPRVSPGLRLGGEEKAPDSPTGRKPKFPTLGGGSSPDRGVDGKTRRGSRLGSLIAVKEAPSARPQTVQTILLVVMKVLNLNSCVASTPSRSKRVIVHDLNRVVKTLFHRQLNTQLNRFQAAFEARLVEDLRVRDEYAKQVDAIAKRRAESQAAVLRRGHSGGRSPSAIVRVQSKLSGEPSGGKWPTAVSAPPVEAPPPKPGAVTLLEAGRLDMTVAAAAKLAAELHRMPIFNDDLDPKMLTNLSLCLLKLQTCPDGDIRSEAMRILVRNVAAHDETLATQLQRVAFISSVEDYRTLCHIQQAAKILWRLSTYVLDMEEDVRSVAVAKAVDVLRYITDLARAACDRDADRGPDHVPKELAILRGSNILPEVLSLVRLPAVRAAVDPDDELLEPDGAEFQRGSVDSESSYAASPRPSLDSSGASPNGRRRTLKKGGDDRYCDLRPKPEAPPDPGRVTEEEIRAATPGGGESEVKEEETGDGDPGVSPEDLEEIEALRSAIHRESMKANLLSPEYRRRTMVQRESKVAAVRNTLRHIDDSRAVQARRRGSAGSAARCYDRNYMVLMERCMEFIELYCRGGPSFQEEVAPHARHVQEHLAVGPLEASVARALGSVFRSHPPILSSLAPSISETVVELTCVNGRRLPYVSLLRGMLYLDETAPELRKLQSSVLQVVIDNQPVLLDHLGEDWQDDMRAFVEKREYLFAVDSVVRYHAACIDLLGACANGATARTLHSLLSFEQCAATVIGAFSEEKQLEMLVEKHSEVYLECTSCSPEMFGSMISWIWPDAHLRLLRQTVSGNRNTGRGAAGKASGRDGASKAGRGGGVASFLDAASGGPPTKSLMEEFAEDVRRCLRFRADAARAADEEEAWGPGGPDLGSASPAHTREPVPEAWHSGKLVVDYVCDCVVPAVEACYGNKYLMRELMRGKLRPMDDRCRKKLAVALFDFVAEVGPDLLDAKQLARVHGVLERYLDVESVLTADVAKQAVTATERAAEKQARSKALELRVATHADGGDEASLVGSCWRAFVLSFVELGPQPHEEAVQQIALLLLSAQGQFCIPYLVSSLRLDIVKSHGEIYRSRPAELEAAAHLGLEASEGASGAGVRGAQHNTREIEMALHAFLLMLHYRANSGVGNVQEQTLPQTDVACATVSHAVDTWALDKVVLGLMGLPLLETPSISLMALLFSCQATRATVQGNVIDYALSGEGARFALQLRSLLVRVGQWVAAHRDLRKKRIVYEKQVTHAKAIELRQTMATEQRKKTGILFGDGHKHAKGPDAATNLHVALAVGKFKTGREKAKARAIKEAAAHVPSEVAKARNQSRAPGLEHHKKARLTSEAHVGNSLKKARMTSEANLAGPGGGPRRSMVKHAGLGGSLGRSSVIKERASMVSFAGGGVTSRQRTGSIAGAGPNRRRSSLASAAKIAGPANIFGEGSSTAIASALSRRGTMSALPGHGGFRGGALPGKYVTPPPSGQSTQAEQLRVMAVELDAAEARSKSEGGIARDALRFVLMLVSEAPRRVHDYVRSASYEGGVAPGEGEPSCLLEHLVRLLQVFTTETASYDEDSADCTETLCEILFWLTKGNPRNQLMVVQYGYMDIASTLLRNVTYSLHQVSRAQTPFADRTGSLLRLGRGSLRDDDQAPRAAERPERRKRDSASKIAARENQAVHNVREPVLRTVLEMLRERDIVGLSTIMKDSAALLRQLTHAIKLGLAMARANTAVAAEADVLEESYLALVVLKTLAQVAKLHASRHVRLRLKRVCGTWDFDAFCHQLRHELRSVRNDTLELEQHVGSVELAMADGSVTVTLFRRSPLAIALLAKATWRDATLGRLREIPRGVGVSENMKARAFFKKMNEIAVEALDEAESQYMMVAISLLHKALLAATLALNALVLFGYTRKNAPRGDAVEETIDVNFGGDDTWSDGDDWWTHDRKLQYSYIDVDVLRTPRALRTLLGDAINVDFGVLAWYIGKVHVALAALQVVVAAALYDKDDDGDDRHARPQEAREAVEDRAAGKDHSSADLSQNSGAIDVYTKLAGDLGAPLEHLSAHRRLRRWLGRARAWFLRRLGVPLFGLAASVLGNFQSPVWYSVVLVPYVRNDRTISFVTRALRLSSANLLRILLFMGVCMFAASAFVFISFGRVQCDSVWQCFLVGITNAFLGVAPFVQPDEYTTLGDVPLYPLIASNQLYIWEHYMSALWIAINVMAFIFFVLLFQALITGIILNEFTAMYMDQQMLKIDMRERHDHDRLIRVAAISLRGWQKGTRTFTAHETYALNCLLQGTPTMLPVHRAALKETA